MTHRQPHNDQNYPGQHFPAGQPNTMNLAPANVQNMQQWIYANQAHTLPHPGYPQPVTCSHNAVFNAVQTDSVPVRYPPLTSQAQVTMTGQHPNYSQGHANPMDIGYNHGDIEKENLSLKEKLREMKSQFDEVMARADKQDRLREQDKLSENIQQLQKEKDKLEREKMQLHQEASQQLEAERGKYEKLSGDYQRLESQLQQLEEQKPPKEKKKEKVAIIKVPAMAEIEGRHQHCISAEEFEKVQEEYSKMIHDMVDIHDKEKKELVTAMKYSQDESKDLSSRLAAEMNDKLSTNEMTIENVGIKNRPMKIAEEYSLFCSEDWLNAKAHMDAKFPKVSDKPLITFLCDIIMISHAAAQSMLSKFQDDLYSLLHNPLSADPADMAAKNRKSLEAEDILSKETKKLNITRGSKSMKITKNKTRPSIQDMLDVGKVEEQIPKHLQNTIGDYLKAKSDQTCLVPVVKKTQADMITKWPKVEDFIVQDEVIVTYTHKCVDLAWKMVIQRPAMTLQDSGVGEPLCEKTQDVQWGSADPKIPGSVVSCYVYPALYHGDKVVVKGKVLLQIRDK